MIFNYHTVHTVLISAALAAALSAATALQAMELPEYITLDCFRTEPSLQDININRAICDAEATNPVTAHRKAYKHGVYRPVNARDFDDYRQMKEDSLKCPPKSHMYICLGVGPRLPRLR